jgi:hypothetical protein
MMKHTTLLGYAACSLLLSSITQATSLVYESFDYGELDKDISGTTTNAVGLTGDYSTAYGYDSGTNTQSSQYVATGLTFSGISTTGGALKQTLVTNADSQKEFVYSYASLDVTAPAAGTTVYQSFLTNISASTIEYGGSSAIRVQDSDNLTGNSYGQMQAQATNYQTRPGVGYEGSVYSSGSSGTLALDTTYLYIVKYTNVGGEGGGTATLWVLDNTSYNNWMTIGGGAESELSTYAGSYTATNTDADSISFSSLQSMRLATVEWSVDYYGAPSLTDEIEVTYDEIRYGTLLSDIIVIPEPAVHSLFLSGLTLGVVMLRRRRS